MNMRGQFVETTRKLIETDDRVVALLGDISVFSLRETIAKYPKRVFDIGIMEQTSISMAAGLAIAGMIPIFHTIAPFLVERAYEQLKLDFGYQNVGGNFIGTGASFDYTSLGSTHHCPADVNILKQIPNMQIVIPGTADEFKILYETEYDNGAPTYFRLSEQSNEESYPVVLGKANVIKRGTQATVIAVGPMLQTVVDAVADMDVTILYYTTASPFDAETLQQEWNGKPILLCEPYYQGGLCYDILEALHNEKLKMDFAGVPHQFILRYGTLQEELDCLGMTVNAVREKAVRLLGRS